MDAPGLTPVVPRSWVLVHARVAEERNRLSPSTDKKRNRLNLEADARDRAKLSQKADALSSIHVRVSIDI